MPVGNGIVASPVFPELASGRYALAEKGTSGVRLLVAVRGGEVIAAEWPAG